MAKEQTPKRLKPKRPSKPIAMPLPEGAEPIGTISLVQERLIGVVIVEWSKLENTLDELIWTLTGLSFEDGRVLTGRTDAKTKIAALQVLVPRYMDGANLQKTEEALVMADFLRDDRNFIMHGSWGTVTPPGDPIALSLRAKSLPGEVTGETFPRGRMVEIIDRIIATKQTLFEVCNSLDASPYKPAETIRRG